MSKLTIPCATSEESDGYHTFGELYDHRCLLFAALMKAHPTLAWRSHLHEDGAGEAGWWIGGLHLPAGDISYHLPDSLWALLDDSGVETLDRAPKWDGHTSVEVILRLRQWLEAAPGRTADPPLESETDLRPPHA